MKNRGIKVRSITKHPLIRDESGAISIIMITVLVIFLGFLALALDVGHMVLVRSEL